MNFDDLSELLDRCDANDRLGLGQCAASIAAEIDLLHLPDPLARLLKAHWPQTPGLPWIAGYTINTSAEICSVANREDFRPNSLLCIGGDGGGDSLLIDLESDPEDMLVLDHETFDWDTPLRSFTASLHMSLTEFFRRSADREPIPRGYYDAIDAANLDSNSG